MKQCTMLLLPILAMAALIGCGERDGEGTRPAAARTDVTAERTVRVAPVERRDYAPRLMATGTLVAERHAELRALVAGDLAELPVEIGDRVRAGELLFRVRQVDYRLALQRAEANLAEARAAVEDAEREKGRQENLLRDGATTEQMRDKAVTAHRLALAAVERLRAARDTAAQELADTTRVAPYGAAVTARFHEEGEYVKKGDPVVEIMDLARLNAELDVPERFAGAISPGMPVPLSFAARIPAVEATVSAVNPKVDPGSRTFRIKAAVDNRDRVLSAGMFCTATLTLPVHNDLPAVPAQAVVRDEGRSWVWVVEGETTSQRPIEEVGEADGWILVGSGLGPGERVVVEGLGGLADGAAVVVRDE